MDLVLGRVIFANLRRIIIPRPANAGSDALPATKSELPVGKNKTTASQKKKPITRSLYKTQAYDTLRARLRDCHYEPGTVLSERQLAAELGMSKTPVKAALERLEMEGYITVSPQSGITVRKLDDKEIAEIFELRMALEVFALRTIAGKLSEAQLAQWQANLDAFAEVAENPDRHSEIVRLDTEFHVMPSIFLGNKQLLTMMQQLAERILVVTNQVFSLMPFRAKESLRDHIEILQAVAQGKSQEAGELMEAHIRQGAKILEEARKL